MGTWGASLYANDTTCDVRDTYVDFLQDQLSNQEAYEKTLEELHEYIGDQDEPLFWFALAETQWKVGRLMPEVKAKALEWIEKDGGYDLWEENTKGGLAWKKTLVKLRETLESPMRPEKRFPKIDNNPWKLNDVYAYQFHEEYSKENGLFGKYMLIQKIGEKTHHKKAKTFMQVQLIDHVFCELPNLEDIFNYRILPIEHLRYKRTSFAMNCSIVAVTKSDYPKKHLTYLGNIQGPANKDLTGTGNIFWYALEVEFGLLYFAWRDKEYETIEEGVFKYTYPGLCPVRT